MPPIRLVVIGAGSRGTGYAEYASGRPGEAQVVGVAEPREAWRDRLARRHQIPPANVADDWRPLAERPKFADAVIIATMDTLHAEPAVAFAEKGYHILLEKPMATTEPECRRIVAAVKKAGVILCVGHVLRYTRYTQALKQMADSGAIGDVVSIQRLEPIGYWHQAHSFVRGNFRNTRVAASILMAKSCHDIDWIRYIMGVPCRRVASFGSLKHFRRDEAPAGAAARCIDCAVEPDCPYSAVKIYVRDRLRKGQKGWPTDMVTLDLDEASLLGALRTGPYGRCVYACDNDVLDHQEVILEFDGGRTAAFIMNAFNRARSRETSVYGTRGELVGDGAVIRHFDFLTDETRVIDTDANPDGSILGGHGGGDLGLMQSFVHAVAENDPSRILSGPDETLESHLIVFAAERARTEGRVVELDNK